jgi:hypothetical protein
LVDFGYKSVMGVEFDGRMMQRKITAKANALRPGDENSVDTKRLVFQTKKRRQNRTPEVRCISRIRYDTTKISANHQKEKVAL